MGGASQGCASLGALRLGFARLLVTVPCRMLPGLAYMHSHHDSRANHPPVGQDTIGVMEGRDSGLIEVLHQVVDIGHIGSYIGSLLFDAKLLPVCLHTLDVLITPFVPQPSYQVAHAQDRQDASLASKLCFEFLDGTFALVADLLAIKCHDDSNDFPPGLSYHLKSPTHRCSGSHDVVEDENALASHRDPDHTSTFAMVLGFFTIVGEPDINVVLGVQEYSRDGGEGDALIGWTEDHIKCGEAFGSWGREGIGDSVGVSAAQ